MSVPFLLQETLRVVPRRYRLPALPAASDDLSKTQPATALAIVIEQARRAMARGEGLTASMKHAFVDSLARLIEEAMRDVSGDPVFKATLLRHRAAEVREYVALSEHAKEDRRSIRASVNAIAHPGKHRTSSERQREAFARLHAAASSPYCHGLADIAHDLLSAPDIANDSPLRQWLTRLVESPSLLRLQRLESLREDERVRQYVALWDKNGPRSGSAQAAAQGNASQKRGTAAEARAARALRVMADRLNQEEGADRPYRVVTSMRAPATIPGSAERAKSEWDAVLLRQAIGSDETPLWDVCLLVESKASVDAATTDLSRLLRGIALLAHAEENVAYAFDTSQGAVHLRGSSLRELSTDEGSLQKSVVYCCDAPFEAAQRVLGAGSRMQLLSAQPSLEFAIMLEDGQAADTQTLEPVWDQLLHLPRWRSVLDQYQTLRRVRELMVHTEDLRTAIDEVSARRTLPGGPTR
ncbi:3-deoxy-D-arabino-heptulosonate 7-phosphate synthase [Caballeronia sp. LZ062]|nr:3-deoxy-D-arabino-heptulosonate 7-phosphate synthase [Caballeronia sp. LZ062]MDR5857426.1 3-deoxy-D-arabino-heptulosonate 7-phosphate synthase [Caballeronia sp. LZ050]MDR5868977.1 3-deoxy-D-arabino-heptulosonate 7-phosphate synthase [Caballeronia sp. LZ062]